MNRYYVTIPFTGYCVYEIEAEDEDEATDIAFDTFDYHDAEEVEPHNYIVRGNYSNVLCNNLTVELIKE